MSPRTTELNVLGLSEHAIRTHRGNGLTNTGRFVAWLLAILLILLGSAGLAAAGVMPIFGDRIGSTSGSGDSGYGAQRDGSGQPAKGSATTGAATGVTTNDGKIRAAWDGPTTHLAWNGNQYTTAESDFIGARVASPGDRVQRTLRLRNDGPSGATMSVKLQLAKKTEDTTVNTRLDDAVELFWNVSDVTGHQSYATLLRDGEPEVAEVNVPRGETAIVTAGFEMPAETTDHRNAGAPSTVLDFRVLATMQGETHATPPILAFTGANLPLLLALTAIALGLTLLGVLLGALARRRKRCDDCDELITATDDWTLHHSGDGRRIYRCADCTSREEKWLTA